MGIYGDLEQALVGGRFGIKFNTESPLAQEIIQFGSPVFSYMGEDEKVWNYKLDVGSITYGSDFSASNSTVITVNGVASSAVVYTTSHANTMNLLVNALNAMDGVDAVLGDAAGANRIIRILVKGKTAVVSSVTTGGTAVTSSVAYTSGQVFRGVSAREETGVVNGVAYYKAFAPVNVCVYGQVWVNALAAVKANSPAYVTSAGAFSNAGTDVGLIYEKTITAAGLTRVKIGDITTNMTHASLF